MLEIKSTNKGLLLPRIDFNDRPIPAVAGLMIFVTANGPYGNYAVYVYNGARWMKVSYFTSAAGTIGDHAFGGIVFNVDATGNHGYVISAVDQGSYPWGCNGTLLDLGDSQYDFGSGQANTTAILNGCSEHPIAASVCDTLSLNGFTDWFLPSNAELDSVNLYRNLIGITSGWYWTSSEWDDGGATIVPFDQTPDGMWVTGKENDLNVRCVRKF